MKRAVFLDRDGVINESLVKEDRPCSPRRMEEFQIIEGVAPCLLRLREAGFLNVVVTNQPDIARGLMSRVTLDAMHDSLQSSLAIDDVLVCPHDNKDNCLCRKPKPGMLVDAAQRWGIDLNSSFLIGDQARDMAAGRAAGCRTILVEYSYNEGVDADYRVGDLWSAMEIILGNGGRSMAVDAYVARYLQEVTAVVAKLDVSGIMRMMDVLLDIRENKGRLFFLGVGGGAGNANHAVNDFRKICRIEAYTPTDNVSELTARANDNGWETIFTDWLATSRLGSKDGVFIFSVGGGSKEKNISVNIVRALEYAKEKGAKILGIVGRDGGYTAKVADACVVIPTISPDTVTAHTEAFQAVVWHLLVSHPRMKQAEMKWESVK